MKHKFFKILLILVFLMFVISAANAENINSTSDFSITDENMPIDDEDILSLSEDDEVLNDAEQELLSESGSFWQLDDKIKRGGTGISLDKDYICYPNENDIVIEKNSFILEGKGHTIDFNNQTARIILFANNVVLNNITFKNSANIAVFCIASNCKITNCNFIDNHGDQASATLWYGFNGLIENVTYINNTAGTMGALGIRGSNNILNNVTFINNSASSAGALAILGSRNNHVKNSRFINNTATGGYQEEIQNAANGGFAGAFYNQANGTVVENTLFQNNNASYGSGGGFYTIHSKDVVVNNCSFVDNYGIYAAGIYINGQNVLVNDSYFEGNSAYDGAGLTMKGSDNIIANSTFKNNNAVYGGGAITSSSGEDSSVDNCTFESNSAGNYGGALSLWKVNVKNSTFTGNTALFGGAIYTVNSTIRDCEFENNDAPHGKAIFAVDDANIISNVGDIESEEKHKQNIVEASKIQDGFFINLTNGYCGFCVEMFNSPPMVGIQIDNMTIIRNSQNQKDVSEYLKILFYVFIDHIGDIENLDIQKLVWVFTHDDYEKSTNEKIQKTIELYDSGFRVKNENAEKLLENGSMMVYNFAALVTPAVEQNMFIFKFEYKNVTNQTVDKKALNKTVFVGDEFRYEITVTNNGTQPLTDVYIEDVDFSSNMEFIRAENGTGVWKFMNDTIEVFKFNFDDLTQSKYRNISARWVLTTPLLKGQKASIILIFKAKSNGVAVNNVTSGFDNLYMSNDTNNETTIYDPDLTVRKITLTPVVEKGSLTTFKIIVNNTGNMDLTDVFVLEKSYEGLIYDSFEGVNWTRKGDKFIYLNTLKVGEDASFNITFKTTKAGNFTNVVVAGGNNTENKTTNNTTRVLKSDLDVSKITMNRTVKVGEYVEFEIVVRNTGEVDLRDVFVEETKYDDGLEYSNYYSVTGSWTHSLNKNKHVFTLSDLLKVAKSASFRVIFKVTREGNLTNTVSAGYNNTTTTNSTNSTEVINDTDSDNGTTPENKTVTVNQSVPKNKTGDKNLIVGNVDEKATGNPLMALLMALAIIPIRRFKK